MKNFTILIDMDDTIENLTDAWIDWLNKKHGTNTTRDDITGWNFSEAFPTLSQAEAYEPLCIDEFWDTVKPIPWAFEIMSRLRAEGHKIYIVTSSIYKTIPAKMTKVLFKYFPFISWDNVIVAADKTMIRGDIMIDDAPHNLMDGDYDKILFTAPHNKNFVESNYGMFRANNWQQVYDIIRNLQQYYTEGETVK